MIANRLRSMRDGAGCKVSASELMLSVPLSVNPGQVRP